MDNPNDAKPATDNYDLKPFGLGAEDAVALQTAAEAGKDDLNQWWLDAGQRFGFVWTTVADLEILTDDTDVPTGATFMAAVYDGVETHSDLEFEKWVEFYGHDNLCFMGKVTTPPGYFPGPILAAAFAAGRKVAAENLAKMAPQPHDLGTTCEGCGLPVCVGHAVHLYDDVGEVHFDCDNPYRLPTSEEKRDAEAEAGPVYVLLGEPTGLYDAPEQQGKPVAQGAQTS